MAEADATAAVQAAPRYQPLPFRFTGRTDEYFRLWIVNLALTLLSIGIYSAWAKVRSERYFYGNTSVGGTPFEYLAEPLAILKGRAIAAVLLLAYLATAHWSPQWNLLMLGVLALLFPWMLTRSLAFRARYSAWRSIRFGFDGRYAQALVHYVLWPFASLFTLYLAFPWVVRNQSRWLVSHHRFGRTPLRFDAPTADFYAVYLLALGLWFAIGVAMVAFIFAAFGAAGSVPAGERALDRLGPVIAGLGYLAMLSVGVFIRAATANILYNHLQVGDCRFRSTISGWDMAWLFCTNTLAIIATLGLAYPWARIRVARYRAEHLAFVPVGDPDQFLADAHAGAAAAGSEAADLFDVDISW